MGGSSPADQQREAAALVRARRPRAVLPDGLTVTLIASRAAATSSRWTRPAGLALGAGALAWLLAWLASRHGVTRARRAARGPLALSRTLAIRTAVTIGAPALLVYARSIPLPRLGGDAANAFAHAPETISIVALGLTPVLLAYVLVEIVALAIPSLRARRHAGPAARAPLERAALRLAVAIALVQGWTVATLLQEAGGGLVSIADDGTAARTQLALVLAAGALLPALAAAVITRWGLCNGWHAVIASSAALVLYRRITTEPAAGVDDLRVAAVTSAALVAVVVIALVSVRHRGARLPPGGVLPVLVAPFALTIVMLSLMLDPPLIGRALRLVAEPAHTRWITLAAIAGAIALTGAWRQPVGAAAAALASGVLLALSELSVAATEVGLAAALLAVTALGVLAGLRAHATLAAPTVLAEVHDADRADRVADALTDAGVPHELVGVHAQALLPTFTPFAPVTIVVPRARLDEAARLADPILRPAAVSPEQAAAVFD
jgi:hypothetical protein